MNWQLQEAQQNFSELVETSLREGPQLVTRDGQEVVFIVAADEYHRLTPDKPSFKEFLLAGPPVDELEIYRDESPTRQVDLDDAAW